MDKNRPLPIFDQIVRTKDFAHLEDFTGPKSWEKLSGHEREMLAILFVWRADSQRESGHEVLDSLQMADKIAPNSPRARYWQGMFWLRLGSATEDAKDLLEACAKFAAASDLDAEFTLAICAWGIALTKLGIVTEDLGCFSQADEKFRAAAAIKGHKSEESRELFWDWGEMWRRSGDLSGEAVDYHTAIEKFQVAASFGAHSARFWLDFGHAFASLSLLVGERVLLSKAVNAYVHAVEEEPKNYEGWFSIGVAFTRLFEVTNHEQDFLRAHDAMSAASKLDATDHNLWLEWASLLFSQGGRSGSAKSVELGLQKVEKALELAPTQIEGVSASIHGLTLLGVMVDQFDLLKEAQTRSERGVELFCDSAELWCRYGEVLLALGSYFNEPIYYRTAMEKFTKALSIDSSFCSAHFGIARASLEMGLANDLTALERAGRHLSRVVELDPNAAEGWNQWGVTLLRMAELSEDYELLEQAIEKFSRAIDMRSEPEVEWVYNYASAIDYLGTFGDEPEPHQRAIDLLHNLLEADPEDTTVMFQLAVAWHHLAEVTFDVDCYREALALFAQLAAINPDEDLIWDEWGCMLLAMARLVDDETLPQEGRRCRQEAEQKLMHAVSLGSGEALYHLAWLYAQLDQADVSCHFLKRAATQNALPSLEQLLHDEWLEPIRNSHAFREFLEDISGF